MRYLTDSFTDSMKTHTDRRSFLRCVSWALTGSIFLPRFLEAATTSIKRAYASPASMTCTLASLANSAARESTAVDNTSNLYLDAMVYLACKLQTGTPGADLAVLVYF